MMTIAELLTMDVGQKIGGGFVLTVKKTKKAVRLPSKRYIHTVVLFDTTGEILADFKDPSPTEYNPMKKGQQVSIIVAEIQAADSTGRAKIDQTGMKLYVDQYTINTMTIAEYEDELSEEEQRWDAITRGKIRHGLVCSCIKAGFNIYEIKTKYAPEIEALVEYISKGLDGEK